MVSKIIYLVDKIIYCLYIFIDESGNLDFSAKGTKHFVISAISTIYPMDLAQELQNLKYDFLKNNFGGNEFEYFHASEDRQETRNKVFTKIASLQNKFQIDYIYANKSEVDANLQGTSFYNLLGIALADNLVKKNSQEDFQKIIIVFDKLLKNKDQNNFLKELKPKLKKIGKPYAIYFHRTLSDFNGQIADYCAWAKYVSLERGENRPLNSIKDIEQTSVDIFKK